MSAPAAVTRSITPEQAAAFLAHDPVATVELLTALRYDREIQCVGALVDGVLAGVLVVGQEDDDALAARFEAAEGGALLSLIAACPPGVRRIAVHRPWTVPALTSVFRLIPEQPSETVFAATQSTVPPAPTVRLVRVTDAPIVAASAAMMSATSLLDMIGQGFRPFGIFTRDRLIAHAIAANTTDWTEEVMSVWTAPRRRGQGLATAVVATAAADILSRGKTAIYVASVTNRASQRVASKVGFRPSYNITTYRVLPR
ncbi:MAG: GNAT family N-acetyltransferase [Chloroflexota bacterium]|nr:GNAT family N-acetyltransferase [Chloroflexota bacterium]